MSYQIRYSGNAMVKKEKIYRKPNMKLAIIICLTLALVGMFRIEVVRNFFIPGDPKVTKAAFSSFTQELKNGKRFSDAVAVFCKHIIESDTLE